MPYTTKTIDTGWLKANGEEEGELIKVTRLSLKGQILPMKVEVGWDGR